MVPRFWSHGHQLAVDTRTGATPVPPGAEAKTQVLYLCELHGNWPTNMKAFKFPIHQRKTQKNAPSPLKFPKDFKFSGNWNEDFLWEKKYRFRPEEGGLRMSSEAVPRTPWLG